MRIKSCFMKTQLDLAKRPQPLHCLKHFGVLISTAKPTKACAAYLMAADAANPAAPLADGQPQPLTHESDVKVLKWRSTRPGKIAWSQSKVEPSVNLIRTSSGNTFAWFSISLALGKDPMSNHVPRNLLKWITSHKVADNLIQQIPINSNLFRTYSIQNRFKQYIQIIFHTFETGHWSKAQPCPKRFTERATQWQAIVDNPIQL